MEFFTEVVLDGVIDSLKLFPFLYLAYLLMEVLEHKAKHGTEALIRKAGRLGPLFGGVIGAVPQCGFSAAASGLFSGRLITIGTLIAVFLSTSDELIAVAASSVASGKITVTKLLVILAVKVVFAIIVGFIVDIIASKFVKTEKETEICDICEREHCHCEEQGVFLSALNHSLRIFAFILAVTLAINTLIFFIGEDVIKSAVGTIPVVGELIAGLVGLIPNCAASVVITELYIDGIITSGQMLSGLFAAAGVGLLVLFRTNRNIKQNIAIAATLYFSGVLLGTLIEVTGLAALIGL
ncbi:MAG: arsenic efflux protein [Clostridia bacterium]|nr:arsenic efflux protein [Clostridia bacterium]